MKRDLEPLRNHRFDLLIVGGGITGAGAALEAVMRGLQVALVDKGDFAGGTSSVSSKLIHGGLRYLEHFQFRLVYEALHERRLLLANAPHLVHPLRFVVPVYRRSRLPRWRLRLGLSLYDLLAGNANLSRSRPLNRKQLEREFPQLRAEELIGGACYFDAQMEDARLCLEVIRTAAEHGAGVANYVEAVGFERRDDAITSARVRDRVKGEEFVIQARQILNATGPWVDSLCKLAGDAEPPHLRPTKGVHLILPDQGLGSAFLLLHPRDGRVFFVIPWLGRTLVGTTDTFTDEPPDRLGVSPEEIAYLLEGYNAFFTPVAEPDAVINTLAGLRPLIVSKSGDPSAVSREFHLFRSKTGLLSVVGGKYTTYRHMAEAIVDEVERGLNRRSHRRGLTRQLKLDGAPEGDWTKFRDRTVAELGRRCQLEPGIARHLVNRYGRRAGDVAAHVEKDPKLAQPILAGEPDLKAELAYQRDHEMAIHPEDHLLRRTRLGLFHPELLDRSRSPSARG